MPTLGPDLALRRDTGEVRIPLAHPKTPPTSQRPAAAPAPCLPSHQSPAPGKLCPTPSSGDPAQTLRAHGRPRPAPSSSVQVRGKGLMQPGPHHLGAPPTQALPTPGPLAARRAPLSTPQLHGALASSLCTKDPPPSCLPEGTCRVPTLLPKPWGCFPSCPDTTTLSTLWPHSRTSPLGSQGRPDILPRQGLVQQDTGTLGHL